MVKADPKLISRLKRIEGQVRGISRMVAEERYCIDVITQTRAVRAALAAFEREVLKGHASNCIVDAVQSGNATDQKQKFAELVDLLLKQEKM